MTRVSRGNGRRSRRPAERHRGRSAPVPRHARRVEASEPHRVRDAPGPPLPGAFAPPSSSCLAAADLPLVPRRRGPTRPLSHSGTGAVGCLTTSAAGCVEPGRSGCRAGIGVHRGMRATGQDRVMDRAGHPFVGDGCPVDVERAATLAAPPGRGRRVHPRLWVRAACDAESHVCTTFLLSVAGFARCWGPRAEPCLGRSGTWRSLGCLHLVQRLPPEKIPVTPHRDADRPLATPAGREACCVMSPRRHRLTQPSRRVRGGAVPRG